MNNELDGKKMIRGYLKRIAIVARISTEEGEYTKEDILEEIKTYGNEIINEAFNMKKGEFAIMALMEAISDVEIKVGE